MQEIFTELEKEIGKFLKQEEKDAAMKFFTQTFSQYLIEISSPENSDVIHNIKKNRDAGEWRTEAAWRCYQKYGGIPPLVLRSMERRILETNDRIEFLLSLKNNNPPLSIKEAYTRYKYYMKDNDPASKIMHISDFHQYLRNLRV